MHRHDAVPHEDPSRRNGALNAAARRPGAGVDMSPRELRRHFAFAACLIAACLCGLSSPAFGQSTFFYGGGSRTWSNAQSWWQSYFATTQAVVLPGASSTAIFNTSGSNTSGTAVFTGDASINRLLLLQTATGGLVLRGDGIVSPTLTLGAGGIRVQPGNTSALTLGGSGNQALRIASTARSNGSSRAMCSR
ncbi:MAG: hypothetical protein ACKOSQ_01215 [Planctomycetaceae bacterium]